MTIDSNQLQQARNLLQQCHHSAVFSGAGLSAESGIFTFRDPDPNSLWNRFDPTELASRSGFLDNPQRVIEWYAWRRKNLSTAQPNAGHLCLAQQPALVQITQNVDNLLERAGVSNEQIYHLHGEINRDRCDAECGYSEEIDLSHPPGLRECPACKNSYMRPAVVWFGEALPSQIWQQSEQLCRRVECLIVVGTSAMVYPAAGLISLTQESSGKIIVINKEDSPASDLADFNLRGPSGELLPALF